MYSLVVEMVVVVVELVVRARGGKVGWSSLWLQTML